MADNKSSEGKVIGGKRYCGKTTKLIMRASEKQLYILCPNKNMARVIANQAKDMGLDIPYPITVDDLPLHSTHIDEILIDEVEMVLQQLIGKRIAGMSTSYRMEELPSLRDEQKTKKTISAGTMTVDVDVSDALKGLKAVQREARKATAALKELEEQKKNKYLSIELDELGDVPKVFYKGKEVTNKESINFQWTTRTDIPGRTEIILDYFEKNEKGRLVRRTIRKGV